MDWGPSERERERCQPLPRWLGSCAAQGECTEQGLRPGHRASVSLSAKLAVIMPAFPNPKPCDRFQETICTGHSLSRSHSVCPEVLPKASAAPHCCLIALLVPVLALVSARSLPLPLHHPRLPVLVNLDCLHASLFPRAADAAVKGGEGHRQRARCLEWLTRGCVQAGPQKGQSTSVFCTELQVGLGHPALPTLALSLPHRDPVCW